MKKLWNFLGRLVLLLIVMFAWSGYVWAEGAQENKGTDKQGAVAVKQDNAQTTTEKQTQQKKEQKSEAQEDTQTKQDETNKNKYYSVTDELACGDVRIEAITECAEELDFPSGPCINQKIFFIGKDDNKKLVKEVLQGRASSWACVKDKKNKKNIAIGYGTGGSCTFCAWAEIYDLEGNLLITDYFDFYFSSGGILSQGGSCAEGYANYLSGFRDYAHFKDRCEGLSKSVVKKIKKEVRKNMEDSKKIIQLIGKEGKFLEEMKYREITRNKYYQKNKN